MRALLNREKPNALTAEQLRVACQNGCPGILVGRALWHKAVHLQGSERDAFLQPIAEAHAHPWFKRYEPAPVN